MTFFCESRYLAEINDKEKEKCDENMIYRDERPS